MRSVAGGCFCVGSEDAVDAAQASSPTCAAGLQHGKGFMYDSPESLVKKLAENEVIAGTLLCFIFVFFLTPFIHPPFFPNILIFLPTAEKIRVEVSARLDEDNKLKKDESASVVKKMSKSTIDKVRGKEKKGKDKEKDKDKEEEKGDEAEEEDEENKNGQGQEEEATPASPRVAREIGYWRMLHEKSLLNALVAMDNCKQVCNSEIVQKWRDKRINRWNGEKGCSTQSLLMPTHLKIVCTDCIVDAAAGARPQARGEAGESQPQQSEEAAPQNRGERRRVSGRGV